MVRIFQSLTQRFRVGPANCCVANECIAFGECRYSLYECRNRYLRDFTDAKQSHQLSRTRQIVAEAWALLDVARPIQGAVHESVERWIDSTVNKYKDLANSPVGLDAESQNTFYIRSRQFFTDLDEFVKRMT